MFLQLVNSDPVQSRIELASCLLVEATTGNPSLEQEYLDEAWWLLQWAVKILMAEAHPDPLACSALNELVPICKEMLGEFKSVETALP